MTVAEEKYEKLKELFRKQKKAAIAFSGGVDSTFLLFAAREAIGERALAITAFTAAIPEREKQEASEFCREHGISHIPIRFDTMQIEGFRKNPPDRCYHCKKALFEAFSDCAEEHGIPYLCEGSNTDDDGDYRPGHRAIRELGVASPLRECGFSKAEIREMSKKLSLPTWNKPSFACLASRFVYGEEITEEKLAMVEKAEELLLSMGLPQFRVRVHGTLARIEVLPKDIAMLSSDEVRIPLYEKLKALGFSYVTLDLGGYRTGSMNELLKR